MSPLGLKLLTSLVNDPENTVVYDDSRSSINGKPVAEIIRVRLGGTDYDVIIKTRT